MTNTYIRSVAGGKKSQPELTDSFEIDTGTQSYYEDLDDIQKTPSFTTTATAAGTTTLTYASTIIQEFTGSTTQTIVLPVTTTLRAGNYFIIKNNSTGNLTVNSSGGNLVKIVTPGTSLKIVCVVASGTGSASWSTDEIIVKAAGTDINTGTDDAKYLTSKALSDSILRNFPDGTMFNGRITPSVSSNNLTVAIKTFSGGNPSSTDPVYIVVGGVVRSITAALSVTKNAATNWFNSGSTEIMATNEIDYFVYIGYNATDGVVIGFSRIPYANLYSDFSATSTNEKYCAISTITNAAAGDNYVNIGRFAATLSAGPGYTWSVPTFTSSNLVNRPIFNTRLLTYTNVPTAGSGTPTTVTNTANYRVINRQLFLKQNITVTNKGTASGALVIKYPFSLSTAESMTGAEYVSAGFLTMGLSPSSTTMNLWKYDLTTLWINTYVYVFSGLFEIP